MRVCLTQTMKYYSYNIYSTFNIVNIKVCVSLLLVYHNIVLKRIAIHA